MKIELDPTRSNLREGRTSGIGFALLKKQGDDFFKGVQPISPCKDYLNDVVWSERTGKNITVYGLSASKKDIFDDHAHIAVAVCKCGSYTHAAFEEEQRLLHENLGRVEKLINSIESMLKIASFTKLEKVQDNLVYAKVPLQWTESTWAISLWAFMFRNFIYATEDDPIEALKKTKDASDIMAVERVIKGINKFIANGLPKQDMSKMSAGYGVHGAGILSHLGYE